MIPKFRQLFFRSTIKYYSNDAFFRFIAPESQAKYSRYLDSIAKADKLIQSGDIQNARKSTNQAEIILKQLAISITPIRTSLEFEIWTLRRKINQIR